MKLDNPFDWVKDIQRSTLKVDFVAISPNLKEFKENIESILDTEVTSIKPIHAIIGDYGWGKSHINHYLYERAQEDKHILASYVQCKNLIQRIDESHRLFNLLLNALILDLQDKAPDELKNIIIKIYDSIDEELETANKDIQEAKKSGNKKDIEYYEKVKKLIEEKKILKKDIFFMILKKIQESNYYQKNIHRIILIIDEFEIFDSMNHSKDLEDIWALREDIMKFHDIIWVFSCAGGSWISLSQQQKTADLFGENTTVPHTIPRYDQDDRKEMIWSRMFSLIPGYTHDKRQTYDDTESLRKYCFPFFNKKVEDEFLDGGSLVYTLTRPELSPRRLISNCSDFFEDYHHILSTKRSEVAAYKEAKEELFKKHFFDIIDEEKFNTVSRAIWKKIEDLYLSKAGKREDFEILLKNIFRIYLTHKFTDKNYMGFENEQAHFACIQQRLLQPTLKLDEPLSERNYHGYRLAQEIEKDLRERCLEKTVDPKTNFTYLGFRYSEFQPRGILPYLAEVFHRELDLAADSNDFVTEETMREILAKILKRERDKPFDEEVYRTKVRELLEAQQIEPDIINHKGYCIRNRQEKDIKFIFYNELKSILKKSEEPNGFFSVLMDEKRNFFLPYLTSLKEGIHLLEIETSSMNAPGKARKETINVLFWKEIPKDALEQISKNRFSLVFTTCSEKQFEKSNIQSNINNRGEMFISYVSRGDSAPFCIMIPSEDPMESLNFLTWRDFFLHFQDIESLAKKLNFESGIEPLIKKLQHEINQLNQRLAKTPILRWDEGEFYNLRLKSVGGTEIHELSKMLSELLVKNSVIITMDNKKRAEILKDFYPWIETDERHLIKVKTKCKKQIMGKLVDEGAFCLYNIISQQKKPLKLDDVAKNYFDIIERKSEIIDRTKPGERQRTYVTTKILLYAMAEMLPEILSIQDDQISIVQYDKIPELNDVLLPWFFSVTEGEMKEEIIGIIHDSEKIIGRQLLDDIEISRKIYNNIPETDQKKYLSVRVQSNIYQSDVERYRLLELMESYSKMIITEINRKGYHILNNVEGKKSKAKEIVTETKLFLQKSKINSELQKIILGFLKDSDLLSLDEEYTKMSKKIDDIGAITKMMNPREPDFNFWINVLEKKPHVAKDILEIYNKNVEIENRVKESIEKFEYNMTRLISNEHDTFVNFGSFLQQSTRLIDSIEEKKPREELFQIKMTIDKIISNPQVKPLEKIDLISQAKNLINKANDILQNASEKMLKSNFQKLLENIDNLQKLCTKYSDDAVKVKEKFKQLKDAMNKDMEKLKEQAHDAIKNQKDIMRWVIEEPETRSVSYEKNAHRLIRDLISQKHFKYLEQVMTDIQNGQLMKFLISLYKSEGEEELVERLEFLYEMEKNGILSYKV